MAAAENIVTIQSVHLRHIFMIYMIGNYKLVAKEITLPVENENVTINVCVGHK